MADVIALVRSLLDKQCSSDPLPTWLLKINVDVLAPFLCHLFNWSLDHATVPSRFKFAYVTLLLKKADMDPADVRSYRSIFNLLVISKLLERVVSSQLVKYRKDNDLLPALQSAYRANHLTETAVLKMLVDIIMELDSGDFEVLTLLDLSAAFDSVYHSILLRWLQTTYGLN